MLEATEKGWAAGVQGRNREEELQQGAQESTFPDMRAGTEEKVLQHLSNYIVNLRIKSIFLLALTCNPNILWPFRIPDP
jgi:hypothetical protein